MNEDQFENDNEARARVMVATPTYTGEIVAEFVRCIMAATVHCLVNRVQLELVIADRYSLIQFARNRLATDFLEDESFSHILWIDADVGFDPRAVVQLLEHGVDVVGGAYPVKSYPTWFPVELEEKATGTGLQKAKVLPTGFLLVSRRAMAAIAETAERYIHYHQGQELETLHLFDVELEDRGGKYRDLIGEDVVLCHKLKRAGFDLWVDPDINFSHWGQNVWAGNMARNIERQLTEDRAVREALEYKPDAPRLITPGQSPASFDPPPLELVRRGADPVSAAVNKALNGRGR